MSKPALLLTSPDRYDPQRPNLIELLHRAIEAGAPWARERGLAYLTNAHRMDSESSGLILLAKHKPALIALVNLFGSQQPLMTCVALVQGAPSQDTFQVDAKLGPHPTRLGLMRVDHQRGKRSQTTFVIREKFAGYTLLECRPLTSRTHQIRVHLRHLKLPIVGDQPYGGRPLLLSSLKSNYRLKADRVERPLIATAALHAERLVLQHPITAARLDIHAPWPKDLTVAVKYLRRYASETPKAEG